MEHEKVPRHFAQEILTSVGTVGIASSGMAQESKRPHKPQFRGRVTPRGLSTG